MCRLARWQTLRARASAEGLRPRSTCLQVGREHRLVGHTQRRHRVQ